ncbi:SPRY domain-containing protein 7 [Blattella germanica]|nr:SPRY domain-containing protein 7 [Blattella germanica]
MVFCCIKNCFDGIGLSQNNVPRREINPIVLDTAHMGHEVVIVKNGQRICGCGGALASAPLVQSKAYFEVKIQQSGIWGVGLATRNADLNHSPGGHDTESWGVSYDHIELNFYINGKAVDSPITGIRGNVYPALYVEDGAILDIVLDNFHHSPPGGFDKIMLEQSLL